MTVNLFGDGSVSVKRPAADLKERLLAAGVGQGNAKYDITLNVVLASDKESATAVAKAAGLGGDAQRGIRGSAVWHDGYPTTLGQSIPDTNLIAINTTRTRDALGVQLGLGTSVEVTHEVGHKLIPGLIGSLEHSNGGIMEEKIENAMVNPIFSSRRVQKSIADKNWLQ